MEHLLTTLRAELTDNIDEKTLAIGQHFFKEEIRQYGVKVPTVNRISAAFWKEVSPLGKAGIMALCDELWQSGMLEESFVACVWTEKLGGQYQPDDFATFERWISTCVSNWASCDTLCNHTVGDFVMEYPEFVSKLKEFARSENRWMRRAAAVTLIIPARRGLFQPEILEIADLLLQDADDLVQKGYGWMLKAASQADRQAIFGYVMKNKAILPRTALRYAIEKMPEELKKQAMSR